MAVAYASHVVTKHFASNTGETTSFTLGSSGSGHALLAFLVFANDTSCTNCQIVDGASFSRVAYNYGTSRGMEIWAIGSSCMSASIAVRCSLAGRYTSGIDYIIVEHYIGVSGWATGFATNSGVAASYISTVVSGFSQGMLVDLGLTISYNDGTPWSGQTERYDYWHAVGSDQNNYWISDKDADNPTTLGWSGTASTPWLHLVVNLSEMAVPIGVVIDDPTSLSVADDTTVQLVHDIQTVDDTTSLSAFDETTLYEGTDAYVGDSSSASSTDEVTLSVSSVLEVAETTSASLVDTPAVDGAINMAVDDSASASSTDDPGSITQSLLLSEATSASSADEAAVSRVDLYSINAILPQLDTTEDLLYDGAGNPFYQTPIVGNKVVGGTLPTFTATALSGFAGITGQIPATAKLPALKVSTISGSSTYTNTISAELPVFSVSSLWVNRGDMSSISKTLGGLYGTITAKVGIVGSIADTLPDLRVG